MLAAHPLINVFQNASLKLQLLEEQDRVRSLMQKQSLDEAGSMHLLPSPPLLIRLSL